MSERQGTDVRILRLAGEALRGVGALVLLVLLVAAPPVLLTRFVGWPLPTTLNLDDIGHALGGSSISDAFLIRILAIACWLAWAQVVACALAETTAWARGHAARVVPLGGLVQPLVRQLVVTAALLVGSARSAGPPVTSPHITALPVHTFAVATSELAPTETPIPVGGPTCVVQRRDSLWLLAERHLGDGMRWREIYAMNEGAPQHGGRTLRDPDLILPGWVLQMPSDAVGLEPASPEPAAPAPAPVPAPPVSIPDAAPTSPPVQVPTASTIAPSASVDTSASTDTDDPADDRFPIPQAVAGATLLAAGLVVTIDKLRRRQMRARRPIHLIPLPDGESQHAERLLRAGAATTPANRLDFALRLLGCQLSLGNATAARVDAVRVEGDRIEVLLTESVQAPAGPFEVTGGKVWTLPAESLDAHLAEIASQRTAPAPALATVGNLHGQPVLIDLEARLLGISGDAERARNLMWSMAAELATNPWSDDLRVIVVGHPVAGLANLERVEIVASADDVRASVDSWQASMTEALADLGLASSWDARLAGVGDAWAPAVVLLMPEAGDPDLPEGIGVVRWISDAATEPGRTLHLGETSDRLEPVGLDLDPTGLDGQLLEAVGQLVEVALSDEPGEELVITPPPAEIESVPAAALRVVDVRNGVPPLDPEALDPDRVLVRVLGPVRIDGPNVPVFRRRTREFVVYLALHSEGVTDEQVITALWPGDTPSRTAFNQLVSRTRVLLGSASDGLPYIPHVQVGLYRPSRHLVSDLTLLERAIATGGALDDIEITGTPFAGSEGFEWAYVEGHAHRAAALIERATEELAARSF